MLESLLVPYALLVEDEHLGGLHVAEHHVLVEDITCPHELVLDGLCWNSLEVLDVHDAPVDLPKEHGLVENHLLRMGQQLRVPGEVPLLDQSSWDEEERDQGWQQEVAHTWHESPGGPQTEDNKVSVAPLESPVGLFALVQENSVFMGLDTIEVSVVINNWGSGLRAAEQKSHGLEHQTILKGAIGSKLVIG